jgi:hypothetical protein
MALSYDWSETEAWKNPFTLEKHHLYYDTIMASVEDDDSNWRKDEETGNIVCTQPILEAMTWWSMSLDLGRITQENAPEWLFRIKYARKVGWFKGKEGLLQEWETEGWTHRDITLDDLLNLVGLSTNVANLTRKEWLKRVQEYQVRRVMWEVENEQS